MPFFRILSESGLSSARGVRTHLDRLWMIYWGLRFSCHWLQTINLQNASSEFFDLFSMHVSQTVWRELWLSRGLSLQPQSHETSSEQVTSSPLPTSGRRATAYSQLHLCPFRDICTSFCSVHGDIEIINRSSNCTAVCLQWPIAFVIRYIIMLLQLLTTSCRHCLYRSIIIREAVNMRRFKSMIWISV